VNMGSLARGALLKVGRLGRKGTNFSQLGRKGTKLILGKNVSGSIASCLPLNLFSTHAPLDDKLLQELTSANGSEAKIPLTKDSASNLVRNLTAEDRHIILKELQQVTGDEAIMEYSGSLASLRWRSRVGRPASVVEADPTGRFCVIPTTWLKQRLATSIPKPTYGELFHTMWFNSIPFIGFGFLDNVIMITAGDFLEAWMGVALGIGTMTAAALGNAVSDVAGIGSAYYVEMFAMRLGAAPPSLTPEQLELKSAHWAANIGRAWGVALGCILGMWPLLILSSAHDGKKKDGKAQEDNAANEDPTATAETTVVPSVSASASEQADSRVPKTLVQMVATTRAPTASSSSSDAAAAATETSTGQPNSQ